LKTGAISHDFSVGGSINLTENRNAFAFGAFTPASGGASPTAISTSYLTNLYAPRIVTRPPDSTARGFASGNQADPPRVSQSMFGSLFVSDTIGAFDDRLLVTLGARRQWLKIDGYDRTTFLRTSGYDEAVTTPVIGIVIRPTERLSFYANRMEGLAQGPTAPSTAVNSGEIFPPFRSKQYEVGGKLAIKGLTATLALYQIRQPNAFSLPTPTAGNPNAVTFAVEGEQRNRGVELSLNGEPTDWLRFIGGVSFNDAEQRRTLNGANDGNDAIGVPDYQVNFGTEIVLPFLRAATLTGRVVRTGNQYLDVANAQRVPGWTRFDIGARYVLVTAGHPVTLRVSAENVADKGYWASAFGGYLVQGAPRTVKASATFEF
jgi:iron complex outermembrane receptor protein